MSGSNSSAPGASLPPHAEATLPQAVSFTVHSLPAPELPEQRRTRLGRMKMLLVLAVCAAPVVASYFTYYVLRPQARNNYGQLIETQPELPPAARLPLADLDGAAVDPSTLRGQWLLVAVGGGACDALCERQLYLQRQLREMMGRDKERVDRVWLVDDAQPVRPELLPALKGATVLRAPHEAVAGWLAPQAGQALRAHLYLIDPLGRWMMRYPADPEPAKMKRDLEKLLRASASWDREG